MAGLGFAGHKYQDELRQLYKEYSQSKKEETKAIGLVHRVSKGDLTVTVRERGSIKADNQISVVSEVAGQARIIFLVPEGQR